MRLLNIVTELIFDDPDVDIKVLLQDFISESFLNSSKKVEETIAKLDPNKKKIMRLNKVER